MLRHRHRVLTRPELDDEPLHRTITMTRPVRQMHGLGAERGAAAWEPVAVLLHETGADWDRRAHRVSVLARTLSASLVDTWATRRPEDQDALTVRAYFHAVRATNPAAVRYAVTECEEAASADPDDPTPWTALLSLIRRNRMSPSFAWPVWDEVVKRDPWNRTAHYEMLRCLSPGTSGSPAFEMKDFADQRAAVSPLGSPLAVLPLAARAEHYAHRLATVGRDAPVLSGHWYGRVVTRETDTALEGWFHTTARPHAQAVADLNILAFALTMTQRAGEAEAVFRRLGRQMTPFPWNTIADPLGTFMFWAARARR